MRHRGDTPCAGPESPCLIINPLGDDFSTDLLTVAAIMSKAAPMRPALFEMPGRISIAGCHRRQRIPRWPPGKIVSPQIGILTKISNRLVLRLKTAMAPKKACFLNAKKGESRTEGIHFSVFTAIQRNTLTPQLE